MALESVLQTIQEKVKDKEEALLELDPTAVTDSLLQLLEEPVNSPKEYKILSRKIDTLLVAANEVYSKEKMAEFEEASEIVRTKKRKESGASLAKDLAVSGLGTLGKFGDFAAMANAFFSSSPLLSLAYGGLRKGIGSIIESRQQGNEEVAEFEEGLFKEITKEKMADPVVEELVESKESESSPDMSWPVQAAGGGGGSPYTDRLLGDILAANELTLDLVDSINQKMGGDKLEPMNSAFDQIEAQREQNDVQGDILAANELQLEILDRIEKKMDGMGGEGIMDNLVALTMFGKFKGLLGGLGKAGAGGLRGAAGLAGGLAKGGMQAGAGALKFAGAGSMLRGVPVLGAAIGAADVGYDAYKESKDGGKISNKTKGRGIGMVIGGALGTLIPIPGVGTALGALAGNWIGGKIGSMLDDGTQEEITKGILQGSKSGDSQNGELNRRTARQSPVQQADEFEMALQTSMAGKAQPQVVQIKQTNTSGGSTQMPQRIPDPKAKNDTLQKTFDSINGLS